MKIINPAAFALVCLLAHTGGVAAKKNFTSPDHSAHNMEHIKTAAAFDGDGAKMVVCPSGDCTNGKFMRLSVASLTEYDTAGESVKSIAKFKPKSSDWTNIVTAEVDGINVSSTTFVTILDVGADKTKVGFNLTASIYEGNATVEYGAQNITVPAGALKFTVDIADWPFAGGKNTLALAVSLDAKGPKNKALGKPKKKAKGSGDSNTKIERVDLGDSMFMDAPTYAIVDDEEMPLVNSSVIETAGDTAFKWVFPSFSKTLHYDPVLGDESTTSSSSGSASTSSSGDDTSSASNLSLSGLAAAGLAALAFAFF